jgi:hypothetical protein
MTRSHTVSPLQVGSAHYTTLLSHLCARLPHAPPPRPRPAPPPPGLAVIGRVFQIRPFESFSNAEFLQLADVVQAARPEVRVARNRWLIPSDSTHHTQ